MNKWEKKKMLLTNFTRREIFQLCYHFLLRCRLFPVVSTMNELFCLSIFFEMHCHKFDESFSLFLLLLFNAIHKTNICCHNLSFLLSILSFFAYSSYFVFSYCISLREFTFFTSKFSTFLVVFNVLAIQSLKWNRQLLFSFLSKKRINFSIFSLHWIGQNVCKMEHKIWNDQ